MNFLESIKEILKQELPTTPRPERGSHEWWVAQWKDLATVTDRLLPDDPRVAPVLDSLSKCDHYYKLQDLDGFTKASQQVQRLMLFVPGVRLWWHGEVMPHRLGSIGPAMVQQVICSEGRLWCWVEWKGLGRWICEVIIVKIEEP